MADQAYICSTQVDAGASMVRGLHRQTYCQSPVAFTNEQGKGFCARHAKGQPGYEPKPKAVKKGFRVFCTDRTGHKSAFYINGVNERGARMSFKANFPSSEWTIDGVIPYVSDAEFEASPEFTKWADWFPKA